MTEQRGDAGKTSDERTNPATRRRWLELCGVTTLAGLAGCLGDDDDETDDTDEDDSEVSTDEETDDPEENGTGEDEDTAGQEDYDEAIEYLVDGAELFNELVDGEPTDDDLDTFDDYLGNAESELEEAENAGPTDDLQEQIDAARQTNAFLLYLSEYKSQLIDYDNGVASALSLWNEGEFSQASDEFEQGSKTLTTISDQIDTAEQTRAEIDHDHIDADELDFSAEVWQYVGFDRQAEIDAREEHLETLSQYMEMLETLASGETALADEDFSEATDLFETASQQADDAKRGFEDVRDESAAPEEIRTQIEGQFLPDVEEYIEAIDLFSESAEAGEAGNLQEQDDLYDDAIDRLPGEDELIVD